MPLDIKITKVLKNDFLQMALTFDTKEFGPIVVKGFRVGRSPNYSGYWVQPPSVLRAKIFFLENEPKWKEIERLLIVSYEDYFARMSKPKLPSF